MVCMPKITMDSKNQKIFVSFLHAIGFKNTVQGMSVSKNSIKNQIQ